MVMSSHTWLIENAIFCLFFSGFPYRMGKYTEGLDWGMNSVSCMKAKTSPTRSRLVQSSLGLELLKNGPVAVSFKVYIDLFNYRGGIYHQTGEQ